MGSLIKKLKEYSETDFYGFHMPGHKRNKELCGNDLPYGIDITEIDGFDDLHHCEGILMEAQERAARVFGAEVSFFLINGSTVGNMSAIMSVTERGDQILIARNNHKSVYNAVFLKGLNPVYIYPQFDDKNMINGEISPVEIEEMLKTYSKIRAVVIVSPTYDGVVSDVKAIAEITHRYKIPLIVDEAHGAHFGMHPYFPKSANQLGADIVVQSVHKTLPSLTQTGLLHVNGDLVDKGCVKRYLTMLQSSSPSYILMSSIERCISIIEEQGDNLFSKYVSLLERVRSDLKGLKYLRLIETRSYDKSKIVISTSNCDMSSNEVFELLLNKYHLQFEMVGSSYVTAMTSIADTEDGMNRLVEALWEIDKKCEDTEGNVNNSNSTLGLKCTPNILPRLHVAAEDEAGSEWFYYLYPPGIPFVVPGEVITDEVWKLMEQYKEEGFVIQRG